jgi:hypothetical protein
MDQVEKPRDDGNGFVHGDGSLNPDLGDLVQDDNHTGQNGDDFVFIIHNVAR